MPGPGMEGEIGIMWVRTALLAILGALLLVPCLSTAQTDTNLALLSTAATPSPTKEPRVTAVYGVTADDYLPRTETTRRPVRPVERKAASHPSFDLPDAFYFIGGPVFILLFLRVLVTFLNEFEEKRKEELRMATHRKIPEME